ncbi:MAG: ATP-binding protein [Anaerosacchariphilus sp.]
MNFIGRKEELNTLEKEFRRDGSFVVIYGRRRIGKTTLIKEFIKDKQAFYFLATEEVESQSMKRLAGVVARVTGNSMLQSHFHGLAGSVPGDCRLPAGGKEGAGH